MTRDLYLRDACILRGPGMRPWGADDEDADAMATGRLDPDLCVCECVFIYLIFHLHAPRAAVDVPVGPSRVESGFRSERLL